MALNSVAVSRLSQTWEVSAKGGGEGWHDPIHPKLPSMGQQPLKISGGNHHELVVSFSLEVRFMQNPSGQR